MKKQHWINNHLDKHLSAEPSKPKLKKKIHKIKTFLNDVLITNPKYDNLNKSTIGPYFNHTEALYMLHKWGKK